MLHINWESNWNSGWLNVSNKWVILWLIKHDNSLFTIIYTDVIADKCIVPIFIFIIYLYLNLLFLTILLWLHFIIIDNFAKINIDYFLIIISLFIHAHVCWKYRQHKKMKHCYVYLQPKTIHLFMKTTVQKLFMNNDVQLYIVTELW